jgi:hypothetical protein
MRIWNFYYVQSLEFLTSFERKSRFDRLVFNVFYLSETRSLLPGAFHFLIHFSEGNSDQIFGPSLMLYF